MNQPQIKITGFKYAEVIARVFESSLVNVAYISETHPTYILATTEKEKLSQADFEWLTGVIQSAMKEHNQTGIKIERFQ